MKFDSKSQSSHNRVKQIFVILYLLEMLNINDNWSNFIIQYKHRIIRIHINNIIQYVLKNTPYSDHKYNAVNIFEATLYITHNSRLRI